MSPCSDDESIKEKGPPRTEALVLSYTIDLAEQTTLLLQLLQCYKALRHSSIYNMEPTLQQQSMSVVQLNLPQVSQVVNDELGCHTDQNSGHNHGDPPNPVHWELQVHCTYMEK